MRQVPHYLLIGNGRVARHFQHYFSLLQLSFTAWHRHEPLEKLQQQLDYSTHILLLISDQAINAFVTNHLTNTKAMRIHFSGSLITASAYGAHPLSTFNHQLYPFHHYQSIPFMVDEDAPSFDVLLPGVPNPNWRLSKTSKPKYHALSVLSGNLTCFLWQKFFYSLQHEFNLPPSVAYPYLRQQMQNLIDDATSSLTGPLVRGDRTTIENNLIALQSDPFQEIYKSFVSCFEQMKKEGWA